MPPKRATKVEASNPLAGNFIAGAATATTFPAKKGKKAAAVLDVEEEPVKPKNVSAKKVGKKAVVTENEEEEPASKKAPAKGDEEEEAEEEAAKPEPPAKKAKAVKNVKEAASPSPPPLQATSKSFEDFSEYAGARTCANKHITRELHDAASRGVLRVVQATLRASRCHIDAVDQHGNTALKLAAGGNHQQVVTFLVNAGASIDLPNKFGMNALWCAAGVGQLDIVTFLVDAGASINIRNFDGQTPLGVAESGMICPGNSGNAAVAAFLRSRGAVDEDEDEN